MDKKTAHIHKQRNLVNTLFLIGGMTLLLLLCSNLLFGDAISIWVILAVPLLMILLPDISPNWVLKLYKARYLNFQSAPQLNLLVQKLSRRADLPSVPELYWIPSTTINAFAVGSRHNAAIAITDGLLKLLITREMAGVLAHEVSHIANNDMRLMSLSDVISRLTYMMSAIGMLLLLIFVPLILFGLADISVIGVLLLMAAPSLSALLQLGLSRVREFDADLEAARLTGDPHGLAMALKKIAGGNLTMWQRIFLPGYQEPEPSLLRTHPDTNERIQRLIELEKKTQRLEVPLTHLYTMPLFIPAGYEVADRPRHRMLFDNNANYL